MLQDKRSMRLILTNLTDPTYDEVAQAVSISFILNTLIFVS